MTVRFSFLSSRGPALGLPLLAGLLAALACARTDLPADYSRITPLAVSATPEGVVVEAAPNEAWPMPATATLVSVTPSATSTPAATPRPTHDVSLPPTPDPTRASILDRQTVEHYTVQRGDTLGLIGERYGVAAAEIAQTNGLKVADALWVGQKLFIPLPNTKNLGPDFKILPDSELVYGPGTVGFDLEAFLRSRGGYLADYVEDIPGYYLDGTMESAQLTGARIVQLVAERYSVNPKLLLAVLEYHSGWVTQRKPDGNTLVYPLRHVEAGREGLLRQLSWAANQLNFGFYTWRVGAVASFLFSEGSLRLIAPGLNAGTVGVQHYLARSSSRAVDWEQAVSPAGFSRTYRVLFGNPFELASEPPLPPDLTQPPLQLPFELDKAWAFTGGPHAGWDSGSAWAGLDFAPPAEAEGCTLSDEWAVAAAPGLVLRSEYGMVALDLDGDGYEGTGWVLFYLHMEARDRVAAGTWLNAGDRIGHPSCEGGIANGTHVHLARKYNGEWISADGPIPFVLDGWVSSGLGTEYDGYLIKGDVALEACDCRTDLNTISRTP